MNVLDYCLHLCYRNYHPNTGLTNYPVSLSTTRSASKAQNLSFQFYIANARQKSVNNHKDIQYTVLPMCF